MKFLIDMPVTPSAVKVLQERGHGGIHASHIGKQQATDSELLDIACAENRIIITADLDFSQLLFVGHKKCPGLILFRGGNYSDVEMCVLLARVLDEVPEKTILGSICVVEKKRIRIAKLPD